MDEVDLTVNGKNYKVTRSRVKEAFDKTSESDWKNLPGREPDHMISMNNQLKPIKAVFRKIFDTDFITNDAVRVLEKLDIKHFYITDLAKADGWTETLRKFIKQSATGDLKVSTYPKTWDDLKMKVSFGMGAPARISRIEFTAPEMQVINGFYPVYLYYKDFGALILAYGISETEESQTSWPAEVMNSSQTIKAYFNAEVPRYGGSFVFKSYKIKVEGDKITFLTDNGDQVPDKEIESDLSTLFDYYKRTVSLPTSRTSSGLSQGLFYIEKELESFLITNWDKTELGKKYDLIIEEGEPKSQQYRTDIGTMDLLVIDKQKRNHVVIELKRSQTSDDTVGQICRYMGWVKEKLHDENVHGIIIVGDYDNRLNYALKVISNVEVFLYKVDFKLGRFTQS